MIYEFVVVAIYIFLCSETIFIVVYFIIDNMDYRGACTLKKCHFFIVQTVMLLSIFACDTGTPCKCTGQNTSVASIFEISILFLMPQG